MLVKDLHINRSRLGEICRKYRVAKLEIFGSFVTGEAGSDSDLDILVTFEPGSHTGLEMVALQQDLESFFGRSVDLFTRSSVERSPNKYFRRFAMSRTEPVYERS